MIKAIGILVIILGLSAGVFFGTFQNRQINVAKIKPATPTIIKSPTVTPTPLILKPLPEQKILENNGYYAFQSFNNCGPASLSMALSYYGINETQEKLGQDLRPYQIPHGDNDDKSVTLEELAEKSKDYGFIPYYRPNGNPELVKHFINNDMTVITRTWLKANEDIGHYRVIKGFSQTSIIQDDSIQGKNLNYSFDEFDQIWKQYNFEYLVLVPKEKQQIAETILGEDKDYQRSWQKAAENARAQIAQDPNDPYAKFNLSVALYKIGDYQGSVNEYEKAQSRLPLRALWYQAEPIKAYYELGDYKQVFQITDRIFNNQNRAYSELYLIRGKIYQKQGNIPAAKAEFEKAVLYNSNLKEARGALNSL